ncbi:EF-hand calcium-binding domain-containing protein 1 [Elysia marginata]|uniref:EF-hand calcium-binding domain-containing protein 1 n=1 Tax=Elysia marginata TaxID=1093978 RepID=A0AAV4EQL7_9GAST|nr:EF-hand calcium-binding domain-containing protein 1 [Elysia marginata]
MYVFAILLISLLASWNHNNVLYWKNFSYNLIIIINIVITNLIITFIIIIIIIIIIITTTNTTTTTTIIIITTSSSSTSIFLNIISLSIASIVHTGAAVFAMATFDELRKRTKQMSEKVAKLTGVEESIALNVIMYAKNLTSPSNPDVIDKLVFIAQLCTRFGMSSLFFIDIIFASMKGKSCSHLKLEEYVRMICVFLSSDISVKIEYVFNCYDIHQDGRLDQREAHALLMSSIIMSSDDQDNDDQVKDLIDIVMAMTDINSDGVITLEEFAGFVQGNILCIELLGSVLPQQSYVDK